MEDSKLGKTDLIYYIHFNSSLQSQICYGVPWRLLIEILGIEYGIFNMQITDLMALETIDQYYLIGKTRLKRHINYKCL